MPKGQDIWSCLEPLIRELLDLETSLKMNAAENTGDRTPDIRDEQSDPILDAIFSALGASNFDDDDPHHHEEGIGRCTSLELLR